MRILAGYVGLILLPLGIAIDGISQNIANPDFEEFEECPEFLGQVGFAPPWEEVIASADYYNCDLAIDAAYPTSSGASSGNGVISIGTYGNLTGAAEAIGQLLAEPFETGTEYSFTLDVKKAEEGSFGFPCTGICFYGFTAPPPTDFSFIHTESLDGAVLLGCTETVSSTEWVTETISFTAGQDFTYLAVTPGVAPECYQIIFLDNIQQIVEDEEPPEDPILSLSLTAPDSICLGSEDVVTAEFSGGDLTWNTGSSEPQLTITRGGTYTASVSDGNGNSISESVTIAELNTPSITVFDGEFCAGEEGRIRAAANADTLFWPNLSPTGEAVFTENGTYTVAASNLCGTSFKEVAVTFEDCSCDVWIPNAITADGDGLNDVFRPVSECDFSYYELAVFDRWGIEVFRTSDPTVPWKGEGKADDNFYVGDHLYTYVIVYENAKKPMDGRETLRGRISVIR